MSDDPVAERRSPPRHRRWGLVGLAAGVAIVVVLVTTGVFERTAEVVQGDEAAEQLAEAWRRHRTGTFVVESEWRRTKVANGGTLGTLASATLLTQRPPDRIQRQFGGVRGQLNGSVVRCASDPVEGYRCFPSDAPAPDYLAQVDTEVEAMRSYAIGSRPIYAVRTTGDGCFDLDQIIAYPDPPYGRRAELCFDPESGALRYLRRELEDVVEEQEAIMIRTDVSDADFDISHDADFDTGGDLPPFDPDVATVGTAPTAPPSSPSSSGP